MNLVDLIKGQIGGDTLSQLGSALGTGTDQTRNAVDAAIPSVLAGLAHVASTPEGAQRLNSAIDSAHEPVAASESTGGVLGSLMGGGMVSSLAGALEKYTGMAGGSVSALLARIAPMILGVLRREKNTMGLDAGGVANLLSQQKQNIASAMPAGLGSLLGAVPGIGGFLGGAKAAIGHVAGSASDAARSAVGAVTPRTSVLPWAVGALAVLLLCIILWKAMSNSSTPTVSQAPAPTPVMKTPSPSDAIPAAAQLPADPVVAVSTKVTDAMKSGTDAITSITDSASADTALPKLRDFSGQLDSIKTMADNLPAQGKSQIATMIKPLADKLNPLIDKALAVPGVNGKIGTVAQDIRSKLNSLTGIAG